MRCGAPWLVGSHVFSWKSTRLAFVCFPGAQRARQDVLESVKRSLRSMALRDVPKREHARAPSLTPNPRVGGHVATWRQRSGWFIR